LSSDRLVDIKTTKFYVEEVVQLRPQNFVSYFTVNSKKLVSLSFIVIMTDIQNFCDRNSVTHNKNQNAIGSIHVKNPIYKTWFIAHVSGMTTTDEIPWP
jgi:hypothetical protein